MNRRQVEDAIVWSESLKRQFREIIGDRITFDVPMERYTSLQIGGPADAIAFPRDRQELDRLVQILRLQGIPYLVVGNGTNLLVRDRGIRELVVNLSSGFKHLAITENRIRAGAGISINDMIRSAMKEGLSGLAPLYGIPGTIGGGLAMNAGAWGSEIRERTESIAFMNGDGTIRNVLCKDLSFGYRGLDIPERSIIVEGVFSMKPDKTESIEREILLYQQKRKDTQPLQLPSAGSIFKNPPGASAGKIIEELGLKGKKIGGAEVSKLHGNFIVNTGGARASHVLDLMHLIQTVVLEEKGIRLDPEVKILGE